MPQLQPQAAPTAEDFAFSRLIAYAAYQWPQYEDSHHHRLICRKLEAVERGEIKRLMITMPPRHGKSMLASEFFPAWYLGRNPDHYVVAATYGQDLADDFGRKVKNQIDSDAYKAIFPGVRLKDDSKSAKRFHVEGRSGGLEHQTSQAGAYYAVGVGGPLTGRGAHCFVAGTKVMTSLGELPIEDLKDAPSSCQVLSYSHEQDRLEFRGLQAFSEREGAGIYRITTTGGRVVEATGCHRFSTGRGYVEASQLAAGDSLLCAVLGSGQEDGVRVSQVGGQVRARPLLQPEVQSGACILEGSAQVRAVRRDNAEEDPKILRRLPAGQEGRERRAEVSAQCDMQHLQPDVCSPDKGKGRVSGLLHEDLRRHSAFGSHVWQWQSQMEGRRDARKAASPLGPCVQDHASASSGAGRTSVRDMREPASAQRPSHRQRPYEQRSIESGDSLLAAPPEAACCDGLETIGDSVALVERVRESARVFDIQVSENHNFFANGILVSNCLLIDDPIKDRQEADSEVVRRRVRDWFTSTAYTRLMPGGRIVVIQTRWHEADLSGWLLDEHAHEGWEVLSLPALSGGEALWPSRYSVDDLERIKKAVGPRDWSALYQQAPAPEEGTYFQRDWFKTWKVLPHLNYYGTSDYAVTDKGGDYTVHRIWGVAPNGDIYRLDGWSGQTTADVWIDKKLDLIKRYKPFAWFGEAGVIQKAVEPMLTRRMREREIFCRIEWMPSIADKPTRARGFQARAASGGVYFEPGADIEEFIRFPAGAHDDDVDTASLIGRALDMAHPAIVPAVEKKAPYEDRWFKKFEQDEESTDAWKTA